MDIYEILHNGSVIDKVQEDGSGRRKMAINSFEQIAERGVDGFYALKYRSKIIASVSYVPIMAIFKKLLPDGSVLEELEFDATNYVLRMPFDQIIKIMDSDTSSDYIGMSHVDWDGMFEVCIEDAVSAYFQGRKGDLKDITRENFEYVQTRLKPEEARIIDLECTFRMKVRVEPGLTESDVAQGIQSSFYSKTTGSVIQSSDVVLMEADGREVELGKKPCP